MDVKRAPAPGIASPIGATAFGVRLPAIIVSIAIMLVAAFIARELGGGKFAQGMTAVAVLCAPHYLGSQGKLATDGVEPFYWALGLLALVRMIRREDPRMWLRFGLFAGLGLQAKHSTAFFGAAMVTALMLTPERRLIRTRWSVLGGLVALAVFLPNLIWEYRHGWATLELLRNVSDSGKNVVLGPGMYFVHQLGQMHPIGSLLWLAGLAWFLFGSAGRRRRSAATRTNTCGARTGGAGTCLSSWMTSRVRCPCCAVHCRTPARFSLIRWPCPGNKTGACMCAAASSSR